jgi:uncharacterized membrane protein YfcA
MTIELFIISIIIGIIIGLIGIGGGILLFPVLLYYNFTAPEAIAISLFLNAIPNTLPSLYLYYTKGHLRIYMGIIIALGTLIGSTIGSYVGSNEYIDKKTLYRLYTIILFIAVCYMYYFYC